jgi:hypothetical protein
MRRIVRSGRTWILIDTCLEQMVCAQAKMPGNADFPKYF